MRCLTCGKRISPQLKECPNCGAMVPGAEGSPRAVAQPGASGKEFDWKSVLTPQAAPPPFGGAAARKPSPEQQDSPFPARPLAEPLDEAAEEDARPTAPAWTQYIFPAAIILWFAFRIFGPDIKRYFGFAPDEARAVPAESATSLPELRRMVLCERVEQNQPAVAREKFSRSKDKLATVFTAWAGESGEEQIRFNWKSPDGRALTGAQKAVRLPDAPGNFLVIGELPIGEFTEAGQWSIEVLVDGQAVANYKFIVEP